jgi:hypothetical protein
MPTYAGSIGPKPASWDEFEDIVCSAAKNRWGNPDFTRHGRQGQSQDGIDIYGYDRDGDLVGIQCKNTRERVTEKTILNEIAKAERFPSEISKLYIATTADTDKNLQAAVRRVSTERKAKGSFAVHIFFWNDIWQDLTFDESRLFQHYPQFKPVDKIRIGDGHDQKVFARFKMALPFDPTIRLLKEHDFGGPFPRSAIRPLFSFVDSWEQPENEFLDGELQAYLRKFIEKASVMANEVSLKTVPVGDGNFASVFSDHMRALGPRPEHVKREAREINDAASAFVPEYETFIRVCRAKLER